MNNIENDGARNEHKANLPTKDEWMANVRKWLINIANVPEEHLQDANLEQLIFLKALGHVGNTEAVRKLAKNKGLMYTNEGINDQMVTEIAKEYLFARFDGDFGKQFTIDPGRLTVRNHEVWQWGDLEYEDYYDALKRLRVPDVPAKAT